MSMLLRPHNPDILSCIANLSNDEVFTPPHVANAMLDMVERAWAIECDGASIWKNPDATFLDPFTKSGVFLREVTRRLSDGLVATFPDRKQRVNHILTRQVFGMGITRLTALLARRSVYCTKHANGPHSIASSLITDEGNIWFERTEHEWIGGARENRVNPLTGEEQFEYVHHRCRFCGANEDAYNRGDELESHAYAFIHTDDIRGRMAEIFGENMHFDVIIGNPPYQLSDGGYGTSAAPIYHHFVRQAMALEPRYLAMVIPSRWFAGGKGLDDFRNEMLHDHRIREIIDIPKLYEAFPGVKLRGGVNYFLWDRQYDGPCRFLTLWDGKPTGSAVERFLDAYDVLVRRNEAVPILNKVRAKGEATLDGRVSSRKPFGFPTNHHGQDSVSGVKNPVQFFGSRRVTWIERADIRVNVSWIDQWKVLMTRVQGTSAAVETKFLSKPIIAGPGTACSETYLVAGVFDDEETATRYAAYLSTRFVRFLVSLRKSTQDAARHVYAFVPDLPLDRIWTDAMLYERYGLSDEEVAFVESQVAAHEESDLDEDADTTDA